MTMRCIKIFFEEKKDVHLISNAKDDRPNSFTHEHNKQTEGETWGHTTSGKLNIILVFYIGNTKITFPRDSAIFCIQFKKNAPSAINKTFCFRKFLSTRPYDESCKPQLLHVSIDLKNHLFQNNLQNKSYCD